MPQDNPLVVDFYAYNLEQPVPFDVHRMEQPVPFSVTSETRTIIYTGTYIYVQNSASDRWVINHNMGKFPSVSVVDTAGTVVIGGVQYIDENNLVCIFSAPFSGTAYLN